MRVHVSDVELVINPSVNKSLLINEYNLPSGSHQLITGASGGGKTTFLHMLGGLHLPVRGRLNLDNYQLMEMSEEERCRLRRHHVGYVFQKLNLIQHLTPLENVELAAPANTQSQAVIDALAAVGLQGRESDPVAKMSLGEQQRVAVARILVGNYSLVLADEPTSSLDKLNARKVISLLVEVCQNKTLIVVSHDQRIHGYFENIRDIGEICK
jgi:putative ABC transport system ATP-binding protein